MKNKKKQRKRYTQKPRQDYRQGGRVAYQTGRMVQERGMERQGIDPSPAPQPIEQRTTLQEARQRPVDPAPAQQPIEQTPAVTPTTQARPRYGKKPDTTETSTPVAPFELDERTQARLDLGDIRVPGDTRRRPPGLEDGVYPLPEITPEDPKDQFERERGERIVRTGQTAEKIAAGEIPEGMVPKQELVKVAKG